MYGKTAGDLGKFGLFKDGAVYGTAKYVTDYTGFSADETEQEGYYFPIGFKASEDFVEATMQVVGSKNPPVKMDADNVVFLGKTKATAQKKVVEIKSGKETFQLSLANVDFKSK